MTHSRPRKTKESQHVIGILRRIFKYMTEAYRRAHEWLRRILSLPTTQLQQVQVIDCDHPSIKVFLFNGNRFQTYQTKPEG